MSWNTEWETIFSNQEWGKYPPEELIRFVARNFYSVSNRKNIKILEVGCGPGPNLWYLAREGFTVYGIDGSKTAISKATERLNLECLGWSGQLLVGDITELPFEDNFFDAVIDNEAIYSNSYEDSLRIYKELARVTKNNGKLFSRTFAIGSWGDKTGQDIGHNFWAVAEGPLSNKGYARFTDFEEIDELVNGFSVKEIELISRTMNAMQNVVKEWIIIGEKVS